MLATKIIVPIPRRRDAERLVPIAADVGATVGAPVELVHVTAATDGSPAAHRDEWVHQLAEASAATLRHIEYHSTSTAVCDLIADQPDAIVCMATDASGGMLDLVLGSATQDVLRAGHHRCVLVGPQVSDPPAIRSGPVVICLDGSVHAEAILDDAREWIAATKTVAWVICVVEDPMPEGVSESTYVHRMANSLGSDEVEWDVLHGREPSKEIVDFAERVGAGSIMMATHGRGGLARLTMGSVALRVVHEAPCPVLVRRPAPLSSTVA